MRAWLLLLAVLATFQPIVQVASTEDISSKFITVISPQYLETETHLQSAEVIAPSVHETTPTDFVEHKASTTALTKSLNPVIDITSLSTTISSKPSSISAATQELLSSLPTLSSIAASSLTSAPSSAPAKAEAEATFFNKNSDSDNNKTDSEKDINNKDNHNNNSNNFIIEIENFEVIEGNEVNESEQQRDKDIERTQTPIQSETSEITLHSANSKNNQTTIKNQVNRTNHKEVVDTVTLASEESHVMAVNESLDATQTTTTTKTTTTTAPTAGEHKKHRHHQKHHTSHTHQTSSSTIASSAPISTPTSTPASASTSTSLPSSAADAAPELDAELAQLFGDSARTSAAAPATEVDDVEPATYSNKEIISEKVKPDPTVLVEIENSLLSLFNMKRPPKIDRSKIIIPEAMKQLYAQIMGHELDSVNIPKPGLLTKSANTVRSFTHQESKIDDRFPHHHRFRLHFDIKSIPAEEKLKAAELQLSRDAINHAALNPRLSNRTRYQVLVYDITRVGVRGKREPSYLLLDNKTVRLNSTETVSLDVQPAVDRWLASPNKNYGLLVEVRTMRSLKPAPHHHVRLRRSADEPHESWQHKQPLLFTYTDDGRHKSRSIRDVSTRSKRAGHHRRPHRRKNNDEICRRHSLYVDFSDVGWSDWIVAPPGYDAFYCHGKCPFPLAEHLNSTNHAVVQTLVNNINPGKVPKACCVPTQLEGISMLYLNDQSTVVLKNYQDMTVVGCGCR